MRKAISLAFVLCVVVYQLTGCRVLPVGQEELLGLADDLAGRLGTSQITGESIKIIQGKLKHNKKRFPIPGAFPQHVFGDLIPLIC